MTEANGELYRSKIADRFASLAFPHHAEAERHAGMRLVRKSDQPAEEFAPAKKLDQPHLVQHAISVMRASMRLHTCLTNEHDVGQSWVRQYHRATMVDRSCWLSSCRACCSG